MEWQSACCNNKDPRPRLRAPLVKSYTEIFFSWSNCPRRQPQVIFSLYGVIGLQWCFLFSVSQSRPRVPMICAPASTASTPTPTPVCATSSMPASRAWPKSTRARPASTSTSSGASATGLRRPRGPTAPRVSFTEKNIIDPNILD